MSSGKKSIQVAIKVRPLLKKEKEQQPLWRIVDNSIQLADSQADPIYFDHIFDQDVSNQVIFDKVAKPIVHSAIEGFNGTIFAYGQTSSGKTYTMMGDEENPGVMVLAAKEIFRQIEVTTERQFLLRIGYFEIYNEKIYDLLNKKNQDLKIHETTHGLVSVNCDESIITCEEDFLQHLTQGSKERTVGETNMNERSSRSHAIFRIIIESRKINRSEDDSVTQSVLNLVDLAGSERADQTGARGTRLKEGGHINKSLLFLSNVIKRLSEDEDHKYISYRDSKLTRILQASLGGNALTAIICTIKSTAVEETQSTLNFALRAKIIKTKPQVNETVSDATMMKRLEREIKMLKSRLEEEQRKNESQLKVRILEQRIRKEDLKIISCNSITSVRNREKRRRTWCPSSTNHDSSAIQMASGLPVPSGAPPPSRLQPPKSSHFFTPLITMRPMENPSSFTSHGGLPVPEEPFSEIDEEFAPAEMVNFEKLSPLQTPKKSNYTYRVSITPQVTQNDKKLLEVVEHELLELQEFTNLESRNEVLYDPESALKQVVEILTNRNAVLEKERLEYLEVKLNVDHSEECLREYKKRCDELQIQVTKLTSLNETANVKIDEYEQELSEIKKANEKLAMENREAVNIEFEFERLKNKSKLRENELLECLRDKDHEIVKLEKSLKVIIEEQLNHSKEELIQSTLKESYAETNGKVCVKCEDLQRLLEDNKKVTHEFEKLTLEFQQLKLNFKEIERENNILEDLRKSESVECEKLKKELRELKDKLYDIQNKYEQLNLENSSKDIECESLNQKVEVAKQEMVILHEKYNTLELSWKNQTQTLKDIEAQYAEIEIKYQHLQTEYKQLECSQGETQTDCERLQKENVELQNQIDDLKLKVQDVQHKLLEDAENTIESKGPSTENDESSNLQKQNDVLKQQFTELQTQFEDLQKEYDVLSNELMDNLQESDKLKEQNSKLEEKLIRVEETCLDVTKAESKICDLKSQLDKLMGTQRKLLLRSPPPCHHNSSMRSSGVCIEEEEFGNDCNESNDDMLYKFCKLSECLTQIELEHQDGKKRLFKTPTTMKTPNYKLCLRNIRGLRKPQKEFSDEMENIHLEGSFTEHSFHIVELSQSCDKDIEVEVDTDAYICEKCVGHVKKLKGEISKLQALNEGERQDNKALLENTEKALSDMREQITQLTAQLLEKSIFVENCACKDFQKQIESLEKDKANITLVCEELQEKISNFKYDESLLDFTINESIKGEEINEQLETLRSKHNALQDNLKSQTKLLNELTQQNLDLKSQLKAAQESLEEQKKKRKEECNQMQLEMLEKLEISANKHRDNMKKYNNEWEERKDAYENTIQNLEQQLITLRQANATQSSEFNAVQNNHKPSNELSREYENLKQEMNRLQVSHSNILEDHSQKLKLLEKLKEDEANVLKDKEETVFRLLQLRESFKEMNEKFNFNFQEKENLQSQLCVLQEQLQTKAVLQDRVENLLLEKEQLNMNYEQTLQKLQSAETQIDEFCCEDARREEIIKSLQSKVLSIELLEAEKEQMRDNLEKVQQELQDSREDFKNLIDEKHNLGSKLSELLKKCDDVETNCSLEINLKEMESRCKEYERTLASLEKENHNLEDELNQEKTSTVDALKRLEHMQHEKDEIEKKLSQNLAELEASKQDVEILKCSLLNLKREKQQLEEQLEHYKHLAEEKSKIEKFEFEHQKEAMMKELDIIQQEKASLKEELKRQVAENDTQTTEITNLIVNLSSLQSNVQENLQTLDDFRKKEIMSLKENESLKETLTALTNSSARLELEKCNLVTQLKHNKEDLQWVSNKNTGLEQQLLKLTEVIKSLGQEYSQLVEEKNSLQKQLQCLGEKAKVEILLDEMISEKAELTNNLRVVNQKLQAKEDEFSRATQDWDKSKRDVDMLKSSLLNLNREKNKLDEQLGQYKQLAEEKSKVEAALADLKSSHDETLKVLQQERDTMQNTVSEYEDKISLYKTKEETLDKKMGSLSEELHELHTKTSAYKQLLIDYEQLEKVFRVVTRQNTDLTNEITRLQSTLSSSSQSQEEIVKAQTSRIQKLEDQLLQKEHELRSNLQEFEKRLQSEQNSLQLQFKELKSSLDEQQLKFVSLQATNTQLEEQNKLLEQQVEKSNEQLKETESLQHDLNALRVKYEEIQDKMQATIDEADRSTKAIQEEVQHHKHMLEQQLESYDALKTELKSKESFFEVEREKLASTVSTLQTENSSLEDKIKEITVNNFKQMQTTIDEAANRSNKAILEEVEYQKHMLEQQLESYNALKKELKSKESSFEMEREKLASTVSTLQTENSSLEEKIREITLNNFKQDLLKQTTETTANMSLDASASSSPRSRNSLDSMNVSVEDKLCTNITRGTQHTVDRKNRRLSSFNARRTSYWGATHDKDTMTDPVDTSCNCVELDRKLKECEKKLFIRESQVTALNMELKNHPLKDANAALMKRLQEEQDRNRLEIKRYKQKLFEQTTKAERALAAATVEPKLTTDTGTPKVPSINVVSAETQTDGELSAHVTKLQGKYNDLINMCRFRKKIINELEDKLAQKENTNSNTLSAAEGGEITILNSQCESLKKELKTVQEKYENAKVVLHKRREEIQRLRSLLEASQ